MANMTKSNDLFLLKRQLATSLRARIGGDVTISTLAKHIGTGRTAIRRVLDERNTSITLNTMHKTATALGLRLVLEAQPMSPERIGEIATKLVNARSRKTAKRLKAELVDGFYGDARRPA
jgi:DNA-binding phage protein